MIPKDKTRVIATIPKESKKDLEKFCKTNNMTKSAAITLALSVLAMASYKVGDKLGELIVETMENDK